MNKLLAKVEGYNLTFIDEKSLQTHLNRLQGIVEVSITKVKNNRTLPQNSYYWKILEIIGYELGYDSESMHEIFKNKFLRKEKEILYKGKAFKAEKNISTTKLTTKQFITYIDEIKRFCSIELGMYVPDAGDDSLEIN